MRKTQQDHHRLAWVRLEGRSGHEAGRALLAQLYRAETGEPLPEIAVTAQGKPFFPGSGLHFSISHCQNHAFCCLSAKNVGIDAEEMHRRISPGLTARFLSPAENGRVAAAPDPAAAALRLWVLKEAYAKFTGRGLGAYMKTTDLHPEDPRITVLDGCFVAVVEE